MEDKNPIQVAGRLFGTLEYLAENGPSGLKDIAAAQDLNKSTAHRILTSLQYMGYVEQNPADEKYQATWKIVNLSSQIRQRYDIIEEARPYLVKLMEATGETVHFVMRSGTEAVYIDKVESHQNAVQMVSTIGSRIPLYCSGVGKAMLAVLPAEEAKHLWEESHIERRTSSTITRYDQFERELNRIRKRGYAIDDEENEQGVRGCAAALCREDGRADYAFSISAPINRMSDERIEEVSRLILSTKTEMQKALHWD